MDIGRNICKIPHEMHWRYKYPNLEELVNTLFYPELPRIRLNGLHDAEIDTAVAAKCLIEIAERNLITIK